jgi:hypothetical protein
MALSRKKGDNGFDLALEVEDVVADLQLRVEQRENDVRCRLSELERELTELRKADRQLAAAALA